MEVLKPLHRRETDREAVYYREALTLDLPNRRGRSESVKHKAVISVNAEVVVQVSTKWATPESAHFFELLMYIQF